MRFSVHATERIAGGWTVVDLAKLEAMNAIWVAAKIGRKEKLLAYLRSNKPVRIDGAAPQERASLGCARCVE
jgi:hypothetical protein